MARPGGDGNGPCAGTAASDRSDVHAPRLGQPFEIERGVRSPARGNQVAARKSDGNAIILLVAGQHDLNVRALQRSGGVHGAERGDHHRHPALVVAGAGADAFIAAPFPALEGAVRLEHRVEMADEEQALAAAIALVRGDDMPGTAGFAHVDPLDLETEWLQLGPKHLGNPGHAPKVQRTAVLVDPLLQHRERPLLLGVDVPDHPRLGRRQLGRSGRGG